LSQGSSDTYHLISDHRSGQRRADRWWRWDWRWWL